MANQPNAQFIHFLRLVEAGDDRQHLPSARGRAERALANGYVVWSEDTKRYLLTPNGAQLLKMLGNKAAPITKPLWRK